MIERLDNRRRCVFRLLDEINTPDVLTASRTPRTINAFTRGAKA